MQAKIRYSSNGQDAFDFISTECLLNECAIFIKLSFVLDLLLESCILLGKSKGTSKSTLH